MKRKPNTTAEWIAIIIIPLISIVNFVITYGWDASDIISLVGLAFVITFLFNLKIYVELLYVFAVSQLVIVQFPFNGGVFNLGQVINLGVGINLKSVAPVYIGVGLPGIFLAALAVRVMMDSIFGTKIHLRALKNDSLLSEFLPADVEIIKRMKIGEETSWYLVRFLNTEQETCGMIRAKESYIIKTGKKQIVEFWLVQDPEWILKSTKVERKLLRKPGWAVVD
jgi:hypothetical protein